MARKRRFRISVPSRGSFKPVWSGRKCAIVGYLTAEGRSSQEIADLLDDGTTPGTIRWKWVQWGLPILAGPGAGRWMPCLTSRNAAPIISRAAEREGLTPAEWIGKVAERAARDDLFHAIMDEKKR
jgi:hypothetical protein